MKRVVIYCIWCIGLIILLSPGARHARSGANQTNQKGRALLVGINKYKNFPANPTPGAEEDAVATREFIKRRYGFRDGGETNEIRMLLGAQATADRIVREFREWLIAGTRPGERVFFLYSGHGTRVKDDNGDEADGEDEALAPYDVDRFGNNLIRDDVFNQLLGELSGRMVVMVFDSCHSGTISRSLGGPASGASGRQAAAGVRYLPSPEEWAREGGAGARSAGGAMADYVIEPLNREDAKSRDLHLVVDLPKVKNTGIVIFSAAQSGQRAFPIEVNGGFRGALSYAFNEAQGGDAPVLRELRRRITDRIAGLQNAGRLNREQQPAFEAISGASGVSLDDQPLFGAAQMAQVLAEGNPGSAIRIELHVEQNKSAFHLGERISYQLKTNTEGFLYLLVFSNDNQATCIFPNNIFSGDGNNRVGAGRLRIPRSPKETFEAQKPVGRDVVVALLSKSKLDLGEKENYSWDEIFERLRNQKFFEYVKTRGIGTGGANPLGQTDWQAVSLVLETIE